MLEQRGLAEDDRALGIEPDGEPIGDHLARAGGDAFGLFELRGQRVPVGDEEERAVARLQPDPVAQRAVQVTEMQAPRRAKSAEQRRLGHQSRTSRMSWMG